MENKIATALLQINAIKLNPQKPFTWASGMQSPIYCDNRLALSYPVVRELILQCFIEKSTTFQPFDIIAGVATAGIPWAAMIADHLKLPLVYVRSKPKGHGRQNLIEGHLPTNSRVLVIEDLISTGGSSLEAVHGLQKFNVEIKGVIAIFTYQFDLSIQRFTKANIPFDTLSNFSSMLKTAESLGKLRSENLEYLSSWRKNPKAWSDNHVNN